MSTRREFLHDATQSALAFSALSLAPSAAGASSSGAQSAPAAPPPPLPAVDSDVGSLFPFIQSQAVKGEFPLSFLQPRFTDLAAWKREARGGCWICCTTRPRLAIRGRRPSSAWTAATTSGRGSSSTRRPTSACPPSC